MGRVHCIVTANVIMHLVRRRRWDLRWTPGRPWCWRSRRRCFSWRGAAARHVAASLSARPTAGRPGSWRRSGRYNSAVVVVVAAAADRWEDAQTHQLIWSSYTITSRSIWTICPRIQWLFEFLWCVLCSAVFSHFAAPCKIFLAAPGFTQNFWWATQVRFSLIFLAQNCLFWSSLITWWYSSEFIYFFKIFVSTRGPSESLRPTRNCECCDALNTALVLCVYKLSFYPTL